MHLPNLGILGDLIRLAKEYPNMKYSTNTISTIEYMSPETLGYSVYYVQSDVYSFGVLAYELFLEKDYSNLNGYQHVESITTKKYRPSLEELNSWPKIKYLIEISWEHDWKKRPFMSDICKLLREISHEYRDEM